MNQLAVASDRIRLFTVEGLRASTTPRDTNSSLRAGQARLWGQENNSRRYQKLSGGRQAFRCAQRYHGYVCVRASRLARLKRLPTMRRQAREDVLQISIRITPLSRANWIKLMIAAARLPLRSHPANPCAHAKLGMSARVGCSATYSKA